MRILHIDTEKGFRGGENQVMALMRGLATRGIEQALVAAPGEELARRAREEGFAVHEKPAAPDWAPSSSKFLRQLVATHGITLAHAHTGNAHTLAWRALGGRLPIVVTRRVDFAVKRNPLSRRKYRTPGVHFIAISRGVAEVLRAGGVAPERIDLVPSGIDPERFRGAEGRARLRAEWHVEEPGPVVGFVGAYVDHKDPLNLVEAALLADLPQTTKFVLVGEGNQRPALEAAIRSHVLGDRVLLTGWREDVGDCLAAFDLFVMPSKLEGLCTSLLDAQAVGLPCVACAAGGIPDIIRDGENGLLVPPRDPRALADAITRLWNSVEMQQRFRAAGPFTVQQHFTIDRMVEGTLAVYERLVGTERS